MKQTLSILLVALLALSCGGNVNPDGPSALDVPQNVRLHTAGETSLTFQWDAVSGAERYVWRLTQDGAQVREGTSKNRSTNIPDLEKATTYRFSVRAEAGEQASTFSAEIEATTAGEPDPEPDPGAETVCVDSPIVLEFNSAPTLGSAGLIRVLDASGKEVDRIDMADMSSVSVRESDGAMIPKAQITAETPFNTFMDALHCTRWRIIHYTPLRVEGDRLIITLHSEALDFGKTYSLVMDAGVIAGHGGIAAGDYQFTTAAAPSKTQIKVAADGSGDFCTLQRALSYASDGAVITVAPGSYREMLYLRDKKDITIKGSGRDVTSIVYPNNESYESGSGAAAASRPAIGSPIGASGGRGLFLAENCDNLLLQDLTIENSFGGQKGQAETIYFNSGNNTHRLTIENCALVSWQDTFLTKGRVWVHNSLIAGHVDFIWGYPEACLFEDCEIRSRAAGYIVQARVPKASDKGFVFLDCNLTSESGVAAGSVYLARSGGSADYYDNVVYVNCTLSPAIASAGWYSNPAPNPSAPTATSGWREYGSVTPDATPATGHNALGRVLTASEAEPYFSRNAVLGW